MVQRMANSVSSWHTFWKIPEGTAHGEDFFATPYGAWLVYTNQNEAKTIHLDVPLPSPSSNLISSLSLGLNLASLYSLSGSEWSEDSFGMLSQEDKELSCIAGYDAHKGKWQAGYQFFGQATGPEFELKKGGFMTYIRELKGN